MTPEQALARAREQFEDWFPSAAGSARTAGPAVWDGDLKLAAFLRHQAAERYYHGVQGPLASQGWTLVASGALAADNAVRLHRGSGERLRFTGRKVTNRRMGSYTCIFKTDEHVDPQPLLDEFLAVCAADLVPAYAGSPAWKGVRVFDTKGANRLSSLPKLHALLRRIGEGNVEMVNFYNLEPHSRQHAHRDQSGNLLFGISRIHIPLRTNPGAFLFVEGRQYHLPAGELWCLDTSGVHAAANESDEPRVHLVIDVRRSAETERYFPTWNWAVRAHLSKFVAIMSFKLVRDAIRRPSTVLDRAGFIWRRLRHKVSPSTGTSDAPGRN